MPQVNTPRIPSTSDEMAIPLVLGVAGKGGSTPIVAALDVNASANSGTVESGRNSVSSSSRIRDWALSRPSEIHRRMSSAVTEPYCF